MFCEFYNETCAASPQGCSMKEECVQFDPDKRNHCYVLWMLDRVTKKSTIKMKVIRNLRCSFEYRTTHNKCFVFDIFLGLLVG